MKKLTTIILMTLVFAFLAVAQDITSIRDIQYTEDSSGDSPLMDQLVTIEGTVSAESWAFGNNTYYVQDSTGAWSGILVYDPDRGNAYGDSIRITGTVSEYFNMTQLSDITSYERLDSMKYVEPVVVTTGEIATDGSMAEAYEGVLVKVMDAVIDNPDLGYGEWSIDDGSGACRVDDAADYFFNPSNYEGVKHVVGVLNYSFGDTKIEPRLAMDVLESGEYTRIPYFQQVRGSDLHKAFFDEYSDTSYFSEDTFTVKGVVTMPTGLSYAGEGIKFIFSELDGGPWSAVLSYNPDSTAYPALFEGDLIELSGWVDEYRTGPSNMTEIWITSPINILDFGLDLPAPSEVNTGDLRLPFDAEQWGNVMVYVKDAEVVNYGTQYELFGLDDGTGYVLVDDDSDSLQAYFDSQPLPPLGTIADSVRGWLYHHFGSYNDTTAYKLEPLYARDILWGAGPPSIASVDRDIAIPTGSDAVTVMADIKTNLTISEAMLYYEVLTDGSSSGYTGISMSHTEGTMYEGVIPAQAVGSFVNYFVRATDEQDQTTIMPADTSAQNFTYKVTDGNLSIADVQYTPWSIADSPFEGEIVSLTGVVTVDTTANNLYEAYSIQDAEGAWNGIFVFGINADLERGDEITVAGTVTDYNDDWHFKWDNNTVILAEEFNVNSSGNTINPVEVNSGDLNGDAENVEAYEGVLVRIQNATLVSLNSYDVTFDDGSGECLVDGDFMLSADQDPNSKFYINDDDGYLYAFGDTVYPGEEVDMIQGIFTFSFGTYKIEVRDMDDFGEMVGINPDFQRAPLSYNLKQNYPNPFNPSTNIYFELPNTEAVKVVVYNMLGQKVRTLVNDTFKAGHHVVNWNGTNEFGERVPSGVYIYRIKAGDFIAAKKMLLVK